MEQPKWRAFIEGLKQRTKRDLRSQVYLKTLINLKHDNGRNSLFAGLMLYELSDSFLADAETELSQQCVEWARRILEEYVIKHPEVLRRGR
jgi:hypothetical protein